MDLSEAGHPRRRALLPRRRAHQEPQEEQTHHPRPQREAGCGESDQMVTVNGKGGNTQAELNQTSLYTGRVVKSGTRFCSL